MATTKTLPELAAVYGPPDPAMRGALLSATSTDTFGDDGAQMGTERVLTDVNRMLPTAIDAWERADTAQRRLLLGVGPGVFAVHLAEALALEALWARRIGEEAGDAGTRTGGTQGLEEVHAEAVTARGVAVSGLRVVAGANRSLQREIAEATGTAESEEALAQGLERLAALGGAWAAGPALGALCAQGGLDAAWVADTLALAARLRAADREEGRRRMEGVSQAELDHQDGVVLHLLRSLVRVFDAANRADRRLPRLTPQATRRFFGRDESADPEMSDEPT